MYNVSNDISERPYTEYLQHPGNTPPELWNSYVGIQIR